MPQLKKDISIGRFQALVLAGSLVLGLPASVWAKPGKARLTAEQRGSLKEFKKAHRQERLDFTKKAIQTNRGYVRDVRSVRREYTQAIRQARKGKNKEAAADLKTQRKEFKTAVKSDFLQAKTELAYFRAVKANVDGKGAGSYEAPAEGGKWKKTGNAAPKSVRQHLRAINKDTRERIKSRREAIKEAKASGDYLGAAMLGFENTKDKQELTRVGQPARHLVNGESFTVKPYGRRVNAERKGYSGIEKLN